MSLEFFLKRKNVNKSVSFLAWSFYVLPPLNSAFHIVLVVTQQIVGTQQNSMEYSRGRKKCSFTNVGCFPRGANLASKLFEQIMDPVSFIPDNALKKKLANKEIVSGLFLCEIRQPSVMQMLYNGGFDFVIIDGFIHFIFRIFSKSPIYRFSESMALLTLKQLLTFVELESRLE